MSSRADTSSHQVSNVCIATWHASHSCGAFVSNHTLPAVSLYVSAVDPSDVGAYAQHVNTSLPVTPAVMGGSRVEGLVIKNSMRPAVMAFCTFLLHTCTPLLMHVGLPMLAGSSELFVANLSWDTTSQDLSSVFAPLPGFINARVILKDGKSRGFGFVKFDSPQNAEAAVNELNEATLDGRPLLVRLSDPNASRPPREPRNNFQEGRREYGDDRR